MINIKVIIFLINLYCVRFLMKDFNVSYLEIQEQMVI